MSILDKLLDKKGINSIEDLSADERATFDQYKLTLGAKTVSIRDLEEFCKTQIKIIEGKFAGPETKYDSYLKASLNVYLTLLRAIEAPKIERENLERYLIALVKEQ